MQHKPFKVDLSNGSGWMPPAEGVVGVYYHSIGFQKHVVLISRFQVGREDWRIIPAMQRCEQAMWSHKQFNNGVSLEKYEPTISTTGYGHSPAESSAI